MQKPLEDIIVLHMYIINDDHIMYGCSDMEHDRHNFLSFCTVFCPFTPLTTQKIKIFKNEKNTRNIIILQMWNMNNNHMMYGS